MIRTALAEAKASYAHIGLTPLTAAIGAEIAGVDLGHLTDEQFDEIRQAYLEHQVIFFRDQEITPGAQKAFAERFGPLHIHPAAPHLEGDPAIFVIRTDKNSRYTNGERWHTDVSCEAEPPLGSMLHMHILPPVGGDTLFANMYAAHDALSAPMRNFLSGLVAVHESEHVYRGRYADRGVDDTGRQYPRAEHPVIRTHPETGRPGIFVNRTFTTRIRGLPRKESRALLQFLYEHMESPEFQVRFKWSVGAVALWDNRCVQHLALWDYRPHEREGYRVTIGGDRPFYRPR